VTQIEKPPVLDFNATVDREHQGIWRYLVYLGCDEHRAADLTQETFFRLLDGDFDYRGDAATGAWLRRTAGNLFRREGRQPVAVELEVADAVWDAGLGGERERYLAALDHCLQKLPPRSREVVALRYDEGVGRAAIAERVGLAVAAVKTLLRRIRAELAVCIRRQMA
jgi:RNA polymerase sigma-70 factor (ECF subfamily)